MGSVVNTFTIFIILVQTYDILYHFSRLRIKFAERCRSLIQGIIVKAICIVLQIT